MHIPQHVIDEAAISLDSPLVRDFLRDACLAHGVDPALPPVYYSGVPLFVYATLRAANDDARAGLCRGSPYLNPENTMLGEVMEDFLSASERMSVRTSPQHMRMEVAHQLLGEIFQREEGDIEAGSFDDPVMPG